MLASNAPRRGAAKPALPWARLLFRLLHRLQRAWLRLTRPLTIGVRLILLRDGQVLLVRHTYQDGWLLPGGGVKRGETLEAAARREAREEVGADLGALRLLGMYTNFFEYKSDHVAVFLCEEFTLGQATDRVEIDCFDFFPLGELPQDIMPGHRRRITEMQRGGNGYGYGKW